MKIREIEEADLARIMEINAANVPAVGEADDERMRHIIEECALALGVEDDGLLVGFCLVLGQGSIYDSLNYRWFMERHTDAWYLDRVAFDAVGQGRGFGAALYAEVERRARAAGMARLTLEVNVDPPNVGSLAFHAREGFEEVGRQMHKGIEVSLMQKTY